jgi:hypothetical protein
LRSVTGLDLLPAALEEPADRDGVGDRPGEQPYQPQQRRDQYG